MRTREFRRGFSIPALIVAMGAFAPGLMAQDPTPPASAVQREHVVKKGDTLWDLARMYYGNPFLWKIIYDANKPVVENPHWIYPVEKLTIPGRDSAKAVVGEPLGAPVVPQPTVVVLDIPVAQDTTPTVLGTPDMRRAVVSMASHRTSPWLSTHPEVGILGRLVRLAEAAVGVKPDKIPASLYPNDRLLIGDLHGTFHAGDTVQIVRVGRGVGTYGRVVTPLGIMRIDSVGTTVVAGTLRQVFGDARVGDYIMALPPAPEIARGSLEAVDAGPEGKVVAFLNNEPLYNPGDVAFISLGSDKVRIGDELAVYIPSQRIDNERPDILPAKTVGVVQVVRVSDHTATVRVTRMGGTGLQGGLPARVVRRAPAP